MVVAATSTWDEYVVFPENSLPQSSLPTAVSLAIDEVKEAMRHTRGTRLFERHQAILLVLNGQTLQDISATIQRSVATVRNYISSYIQGGLEALDLRHSPGRPRRLTPDQEQQLLTVVATMTPQDVGFPAEMNWSSPLVRRYIQNEFQMEFSDRGTRHLLERLNFSCTRPTYSLAKADPEKQAAFREFLATLSKQLLMGQIDRILFEDESMIRDYQAIARTWFLKGQQKIIPTYGRHWGAKLLGTLDYETGEILCRHADHYDAQVFLSFLEEIVVHYNGNRIVMILDNARIHHAKLIQPFLEAHKDHLQLVFLPP